MSEPYDFNYGILKCSTHSKAQLILEIKTLLADKNIRPRIINCVNAHIYNMAAIDPCLREKLNASRIIAADGMSIVWTARLFGGKIPERCNMTEAFRIFLAEPNMPETKAVLFGGKDNEVQIAADAITNSSSHCRVIRAVSGYLDDDCYTDILEELQDVDLILIGMGTPKSEQIADLASRMCPQAVTWHIGGGTILFYAGVVREAPTWLRVAGLQWLHRLCLEPRRMWKRYIIGNLKFICLITKKFLRD